MQTERDKSQGYPPLDRAVVWLMGTWMVVTLLWWAFAFATPGPSTAWLKSAQSVCFGSTDNGLPSPWGWAVLFLAPLSLLISLTVAYNDELVHLWKTRRRGNLTGILLEIAVVAFLAQGLWIADKVSRSNLGRGSFALSALNEPLPESYPRQIKKLPKFKLIDQRGKYLDNASLVGDVHVLTFAYAHCATVCPFLVRDTLKAVRATPGLTAIFLTLDPWRDTPTALPSLATSWGMGQESRLLSGSPKAVMAFLAGLGVPYKRDEQTGRVDHPPLIYVLDNQGRLAYTFSHPSPEWIEEAVRRLKHA